MKAGTKGFSALGTAPAVSKRADYARNLTNKGEVDIAVIAAAATAVIVIVVVVVVVVVGAEAVAVVEAETEAEAAVVSIRPDRTVKPNLLRHYICLHHGNSSSKTGQVLNYTANDQADPVVVIQHALVL